MAVSESRQLLKTLVSAALVVLCTSPVAVKARIRNDGVDTVVRRLPDKFAAEIAIPSLSFAFNAAGQHALSLAIWAKFTVAKKLV